jgi:ABC-type phosphate transport system permease subunit
MNIQSLLSLFLSILFLIISFWMFITFRKVNKLLSKYNNDTELIKACGISSKYIKIGYIMSIITTIFSIIITLILSVNLCLCK